MHLVLVIAESIGLIIGSAAAAILICWSLWSIFRRIGHPAWGPPLVVVPIVLWAADLLPSSDFLRLTLLFALLAAIPFWVEGRTWRIAWTERQRSANPAEIGHA